MKLLLIVLANFANQAGEAWPSYLTLAKKAGLSRRQVMRNLGQLEALGLVTVQRRTGRTRSNTYRIVLPGDDRPIPTNGYKAGQCPAGPPKKPRPKIPVAL